MDRDAAIVCAQLQQAMAEYETALKLEPKNRYASEALKRVKKH